MKIAFASDLHFEFQEFRIMRLIEQIEQDTDVLVLAGDIQMCNRIIIDLLYLSEKLPDIHIVYVAGNHEFYSAKISEVETSLQVAFQHHCKVHYLERSTFELNDVVFIGTTLWTGFDAYPEFEQSLSEENALCDIYDFKAIFQGLGNFQPHHCKQLFKKNCDWLSKTLEKQNNKTTIVVTHFPPLPSLSHKHIPANTLSNYFQADCSAIIHRYMPDYWIYGHNHWSDTQQHENTICLSNQLGYPNEHCNIEKMLQYIIID